MMFRMNHKYDIDWLAGWIICQRLGVIQVDWIMKFWFRLCFLLCKIRVRKSLVNNRWN